MCNIKCLKSLKVVFTVFLILFWCAGVTLVGVGIWTLVDRFEYSSLLGSDNYIIVVSLMIVAGIVVIIVGFLGCCGSIKDNRFMLIAFFVMVVCVFLVELSAGIVAFAYRGQLENELEDSFLNAMNKYAIDDKETKAIDKAQEKYWCCGATRYYQWNETVWFNLGSGNGNKTLAGSSDKLKVPDSCCKPPIVEGCGEVTHPSNINYKGCIQKLSEYIEDHLLILGAVGLGVSILQLLGLIVTALLIHLVEEY
ncbi:CD151 antigen-like isoform X2 [Dendronephthya gigantea]|uniref:CD151 antigen-like isoform X2 n=1 Tax=Dendronephthya gigantea TaxID=151771 RepID=UPI00106B42C0|nr:CD151 antigen-like isoform X2 [Dendronephthya gigantea]XP_028416112.1 CD151 antigen-like isoform X2 [Dendronephthya gigantea]